MSNRAATFRFGPVCLGIVLSGLNTILGGCTAAERSVGAGEIWLVDQSEPFDRLAIADGAVIEAPEGYSLTLTVDGVETNLEPGTYAGKIALTRTEINPVEFRMMGPEPPVVHHFRQAIYLDETGLVADKSVLAAAGDYTLQGDTLSGADIRSQGENFNGVYVAGGKYTLKDVKVDFNGNGGNDFAGWGAGIMSAGEDVLLTVDGADVRTRGVVRTAFIADKGSTLVVKNSNIEAFDGVLPADYRPNTTPGKMWDVPWMLGLTGNCRATNALGDDTVVAYINSSVASENWGVLSIDNGARIQLYAVNSRIAITGESGYGTYSIGGATNTFLGSAVDVADYGAIVTGGNVVFAASSAERIKAMNDDAGLGLSASDLASIEPTQTTVKSRRFGVMVWGNNGSEVNTVKVLDGTEFHTGAAFLVDRGAPANIDVDGSDGVVIDSANGIILQLMDLDKAPGVREGGLNLTTGVYSDPPLPIARVDDFDLTVSHPADVIAHFADITLDGDFYNGISTSSEGGGMMGPGGPGPGGPGAAGPEPRGPGTGNMTPTGKNLVLDFDNATITGVITASVARHAKETITSADVKLVSEVTNTPAAAVNNGVIVSLQQSNWIITGTSYLTSLTLDEASTVAPAEGHKLSMTVDGVATPMEAGSYTGAIVLDVT